MRSRYRSGFCVVLVVFTLLALGAAHADVRNVILMIGDGMGYEHVKAGGYYMNGAAGTLCFEPYYKCGVKTRPLDYTVHPITDSAAAASAMATGHKVNYLTISQSPSGVAYTTILEEAKATGKRTGLIGTDPITRATPAAFGAHEADRNSLIAIGNDFLNSSRPDVLMGGGGTASGGSDYFSAAQIATAQSLGYQTAYTKAQMDALSNSTSRVLGLYTTNEMTYEYDRLPGTTEPHLSEMAAKTLALMDTDPDGFFLMIEGAKIDYGAHAHDIARTTREVVEFNNAVQVVMSWVQARSDTLLIVTADHETGGLTATNQGAGSYPTATWSSTDHTGVNVPLYALGLHADLVDGYISGGAIDNTNVFSIMHAAYTYDATPPVISNVHVSNDSSSSVTITWNTDDPSTSQVLYGATTAYGQSSAENTSLVTSHSVTLSGLGFRAAYHFKVKSRNGQSLTSYSDDGTFTTYEQGIPVISNVQVTGVTGTGATVTWETNLFSSSQVEYGATSAYGLSSLEDGSFIHTHSITLSGLSPGTLYHFRAKSTTPLMLTGYSADATFTTLDNTPPVISSIQAAGVTASSATITWTTDDPSSSQVYHGTTPAYGQSSSKDTALVTSHSVNLSGLSPGAVYHYAVESTNGAALTTRSDDATLVTQSAPLEFIVDNPQGTSTGTWTPLTDSGGWPTGSSQYVYADNSKTSTTATFTWRPDLPLAGHYNVYCWYKSGSDRTTSARYTVAYAGGQILVGVVNQTLTGGQWVKIADAKQFDAGTSGYISLTNKTGETTGTKKVVADAIKFEYAENDTTPPSVPLGLAVTVASTSELDQSWSPSTDDFIVAGYKVYRNGQAIAITTATQHMDTGLAANTQGSYTVSAFDGRFNESAQSAAVVRSTLARALHWSQFTCTQIYGDWTSPRYRITNDGFGPGKVAYYRYVWNGSQDTHNWADTEATWTTATLDLDTQTTSPSWFLHLRGYNNDGVGGDDIVLGPFLSGKQYYTIAEATNNPDGTVVNISGVLHLTADLGGCFYVEESERTRGLRVNCSWPGLAGDDCAYVVGALATVDGERQLVNADATAFFMGWTPSPLFMRIATLGGGAPDAYTSGLPGSKGLLNVGLLVRVAGKVVSRGTGWFVLDDGSGATAKVYSEVPVSDTSYIGVTGVSSVEGDQRVIRTRGVADVRDYTDHGIEPPPPPFQ